MSSEPNSSGAVTPAAPITPIPAPPIDSLAELRRQGSNLLQRDVAGSGTTKPSPGELLGFLMAASKLGRNLDDMDARETAQGIMDFWIANLLSQAPETAEGTRPFTLEPFDECSAHLQTTEAQQLRVEAVQAVRRAEDILPASQEAAVKQVKISYLYDWMPRCLKPWVMQFAGRDSDASVMQRLLLRFIRLKEKSTEAYSVPVADTDDIFSEPKARGLLEQLITAGVVKLQETTPGSAPSYTLAHETLLTKWSFLVDIITQRRSFRQLARGWDNNGRQRAALLAGGAPLQQALDYPHLDSMEAAFLEASRRCGESFRRIALTLVSVAFVVLLLMVIGLMKAWINESATARELAASNHKLAASNDELRASQLKTEQRAALAEVIQSKIYSLRELILVPLDENKQPFTYPKSKRITEWVWPATDPYTIRPEHTARVFTILSKATSPKPNETYPQIEFFIPLDSTEGAFTRSLDLQAALTGNPPREGERVFEFPAVTPLARRSVPDEITEVRYFYAEDGPDKKRDEGLATEVVERLKQAGFTKPIKVVAKNDPKAPKFFIQVSFAKKSLE